MFTSIFLNWIFLMGAQNSIWSQQCTGLAHGVTVLTGWMTGSLKWRLVPVPSSTFLLALLPAFIDRLHHENFWCFLFGLRKMGVAVTLINEETLTSLQTHNTQKYVSFRARKTQVFENALHFRFPRSRWVSQVLRLGNQDRQCNNH